MIRLENITINYSKKLFENSYLSLDKNKITVLSGKSGYGKTSLLYRLGLIEDLKDIHYYFDNIELHKYSKQEKIKFRKKYISIVFQSKNVISNITSYENIQLMYELVNKSYTKEMIMKDLTSVGLDHRANVYANALSGGELQRLAISCALVKEPELLILDEPTSSLDKKNKKLVMDILTKIKTQYNCHVIIASHDETILEIADKIYYIKDCQLISNEDDSYKEIDTKSINIVKTPLKFYYHYYKMKLKTTRYMDWLFCIISAVAIACSTMNISVKQDVLDKQEENLNRLANSELFIVNAKNLSPVLDSIVGNSFSSEQINSISELSEVEYILPFFECVMNGNTLNQEEYSPQLIYGNKEVDLSNGTDIIIQPYYPDFPLDSIVIRGENNPNGIYISSTLSHYLKANQLTEKKITVNSLIPIAKNAYQMNVYTPYLFEFNLSGVIDSSYTNQYTSTSEHIIYVPYQMLQGYQNKAMKNKEFNDLVPFQASGYIFKVKDYSQVQGVAEKIQRMHRDISIRSASIDMSTLIINTTITKQYIQMASTGIFFIVCILLIVYFIQKVTNRKHEYALLQALGLSRLEIIKLNLIEYLPMGIKSFIISLIFVYLIKIPIQSILDITIHLNIFKISIIVISIQIVSIVLPLILSLIKVISYLPAKVFRN